MHQGRKSTLITAYTALATIAAGLIAFDFVRRTESGSRMVHQPAQRVFAMVTPGLVRAKAGAVSRPAPAQTVAAYNARRSAM